MVMEAELLFRIKLPYVQTEFTPLVILAQSTPVYRVNEKCYDWVFLAKDIKKVEAIVGEIVIPGYKEKGTVQPVEVPKWKGKDFVEIIDLPTTYKIIMHRKKEDGSVEEVTHICDRETVKKVWAVISRKPLNKKIKTRTIAEGICQEFKIDRFNRETGSFDFAKLFGNRASYFKYVYYPLKVLAWQGRVRHYKKGYVERLR